MLQTPPPAPAAPSPPSSRHPALSRTWAIAKVAGPTLASVAALAISLLTYQDEHNATIVSNQAATTAYASQVTFWLSPTTEGKQPELIIENRNSNPIPISVGRASVTRVSTTPPAPDRMLTKALSYPGDTLFFGSLPACSVITTNALDQAGSDAKAWTLRRTQFPAARRRAIYSALHITTGLLSLSFKDPNGKYWTRGIQGSLKQIAPSPSLTFNPGDSEPDYVESIKPADGCS